MATLVPSDRLITLARFQTPFEAELVSGRLRSEGLHAELADAETVTANWMYSNAIGGVRVLVRASEFEQAQRLLESVDSSEDLADLGVDSESTAWRALVAALFGFLSFAFFFVMALPFFLGTLWWLVRYVRSDDEKSVKSKTQAALALVLAVCGTGLAVSFWIHL